MFDIIIRYSVAQWAKGREKENKNRMKVTIKMVAEKCNVSPVTVSRVLANHSSVNEKTRETVLNAMQELGYRSKKVEKLMDKKESRYIAVMRKSCLSGNVFNEPGQGRASGGLYCYLQPGSQGRAGENGREVQGTSSGGGSLV